MARTFVLSSFVLVTALCNCASVDALIMRVLVNCRGGALQALPVVAWAKFVHDDVSDHGVTEDAHLATVESTAYHLHIAVVASVLAAHRITSSARRRGGGIVRPR